MQSTSSRLDALLAAVIDGDLSHLLEHVTARNVNYADGRYRLTLLQWAVSLGRLPTTELLLARGAAVLLLDGSGFSALHRAAWCADAAVVRALLFLSPAGRFATTTTTTMATAAGRGGNTGGGAHGHTHWLASSAPPSSSSTRSAPAPALTWRPGAQRLVDMPHGPTGRTALMLAAVRGAECIVAFLLDACGADMHFEDGDGYTAAELAALCGHTAILGLLLTRAAGDGSGRAFQRVQQRSEDYVLTAQTVPQQRRLQEVNSRICEDLAVQSAIVSA